MLLFHSTIPKIREEARRQQANERDLCFCNFKGEGHNKEEMRIALMASSRIEAQFSTIYAYFKGKDSETSLQEVVELLSCTPRNARMVLNKMAEESWITWYPAIGRGKLSRLVFHRSVTELKMKRLRHWIRQGRVNKALDELDNDKAQFEFLLKAQLGVLNNDGQSIIRLVHDKPFFHLNPTKSLSNESLHLTKQIFNGLTRYDEKKQVIAPSIAHAWDKLTPYHWRFYLRPNIYFHHGLLMTVQDVIWSFEQIRHHFYFSHIKLVSSSRAQVVDFFLSFEDNQLPQTLAHPMAFIRSKEDAMKRTHDSLPIGTGPYLITANDKYHLRLEAHPHFFGLSPLTEQIEIWILPDFHQTVSNEALHYKNQSIKAPKNKEKQGTKMTLKRGCHYLLLNRLNGLCEKNVWAAYLTARLSSLQLMPFLNEQIKDHRLVNADGLLPDYMPSFTAGIPLLPPAEKKEVPLVYKAHHQLHFFIAKAIKALLRKDKIKVKLSECSDEQWFNFAKAERVDIWLSDFSLDGLPSEVLMPWCLMNPIFALAMPEHEYLTLQKDLQKRRQDNDYNPPWTGQVLINKKQVIPLFHQWQTVMDAENNENLPVSQLTRIDFTAVWKKPN